MSSITIQIPAKTWTIVSAGVRTDYQAPDQNSIWIAESNSIPENLDGRIKLNPETRRTFSPSNSSVVLYAYSDVSTYITKMNPEVKDISAVDQTSDPLDWYLSRDIAETSLSVPISIIDQGTFFEVDESCDITLVSVAGAAVGLWVEIWEGLFKYQGEIEAINGNVLTMGLCVGFPYSTNAVVRIVDIDQNKDFTVGGIGEQYYTIDPPDIYTGDLHQNRFMITMLHSAESDASTYGDIQGGLTEGIAVSGRGKLLTEESGLGKPLVLFNNLLNIKTNGDWAQTAYDVNYIPKSGNPSSPAEYGTSVRKTFNGQDKSGVAIPVRKTRNEATRTLFRADLSSLVLHRIKTIGHLVD